MRARIAILLTALLLLGVPFQVQAQDPQLAKIADDKAGDVQAVTAAGPQAAPAQAYQDVDLLSLSLQESPEAFTFTVQATDIKPGQEGSGTDGAVVAIQFAHAGRQFQGLVYHQLPGVSNFVGASFAYRDDAAAPWNEVWFRREAAQVDGKANTYTLIVPRADLADAKGAAPFPGRSLEAFTVQASNLASYFDITFVVEAGSPAAFVDSMPDSGAAPVAYPVVLGLKQDGDARLSSEEPFRASNGEATTFIFNVKAANVGDVDGKFQLRTQKLPTGWSVVLPVPSLDLEAGGEQEVPVVATQPFSHTHGATASFILELASTTDPGSVGRIELGARYLTIPQPAGHHNQIWFHSRPYNQFSQTIGTVFTGNDGLAFMNAIETFDGDMKIPLSPQSSWNDIGPNNEPVGVFSWCIPLDPGLQMGLDFIPAGIGHVVVPIHVTAPLNDASLAARLMLMPEGGNRWGCYNDGDENVLATLNGTAPVSIQPNSDQNLEGDLDVWKSADRIAYAKGQNVLLYVEVRGVTAPTFFVAQGTPRLIPGGSLTLPLLEYHDDIKEVLQTVAGPAITPLGAQQRLANPGATIIFPLSVANEGDAVRVLGFNVTGPNSQWATLPETGVEVPPHGTARADIVVKVPTDAKAGDMADLIVQAYDKDNLTSRGLLRLVVTVVTEQTVEDDSKLVPKADAPKDSPAWTLLGAMTVLAVAAFMARRKAA